MSFFKSGISKKRTVVILLIISVMVAFICSPERYIKSVYSGITLFVVSVLPALFPFFFFTKLLTGLGMSGAVSSLFEKPIKKLYNTNSAGGYIFTMSIMSGYPVGAKLVSEFYENGYIGKDDAKTISSFTSTSGPLFVVGTVGSVMLSNKYAGLFLLFTHYIASIVNGLFYRKNKNKSNFEYTKNIEKKPIDEVLSESIYNAIISVLIVGGYIAIFNMLIDILYDIGILKGIENAVAFILKLTGNSENLAKGITYSLIEVTRGTAEFASSGLSLNEILPFIAGFLAFGGLGIAIQSYTFLSKCKIGFFYHLLTKFTQACTAFLITYIFCMFIKF